MLLNIQFGETTYSNTPYLCSRYPENNLFTLNELIPKARSIRVAEKRPFCCKYLRPLTTLHTGHKELPNCCLHALCLPPSFCQPLPPAGHFLLPASRFLLPLPFDSAKIQLFFDITKSGGGILRLFLQKTGKATISDFVTCDFVTLRNFHNGGK